MSSLDGAALELFAGLAGRTRRPKPGARERVLVALVDSLLDWVSEHAPSLHDFHHDESLPHTQRHERRHDSTFAECDEEPCTSAHAAMTEAYRQMEASS